MGGSVLRRSPAKSRRYRWALSSARRCSILEYVEDAACDTDMNVVMTGAGHYVEVQGTAEGAAFSRSEMNALLDLAERGIGQLLAAQRRAFQGA